ncbi:MAG: DUF402 domain-containing protein [Chloroflexota bacterium]|nr:DUF402 domain-containing protein [Chloroflexota bacterium]
MLPLIRIDKRIPDGSIWQARRGYRLPERDGWTPVYGPSGTQWSNRLGGWTQQTDGVSLFHRERPFTISCHGPDGDKRFYVDVARPARVDPWVIDFVDLFLDVMIDVARNVSEKDEHQLVALSPHEAAFARRGRDLVRRLIAEHDPLFDARSPFYVVPEDARGLPPPVGPLDLD